MNRFLHTRETITLIKAAVFLAIIQLFQPELKAILLAVAGLIN